MNTIGTYKLLTVTHRSASLKAIGDYVIKLNDDDVLQDKIHAIKDEFGFEELMYLSTCNRIMYVFTGEMDLNSSFVKKFFNYINPSISTESIEREVLVYNGIDAINHIFDVAASVDSLVVGEREILRQLREAYQNCSNWNLTGDKLRLLMRFVVTSSKRVYNNTSIGEKPVSVVSLASQKLIQSNRHRNSRVLLIGAGQTNTLVAKFLVKYEFTNVTVFNRTVEKAASLSQKFGNKYHSIEDLNDYKEGFDIIIICTGSTSPIMTTSLYQKLVGDDKDQKLIIDLAIPNNVEKEVVDQYNVNYIEIEDLKALAKINLSYREKAVTEAKAIIQEEVDAFEGHFKQRQLEIAMRAIPTQVKEVKKVAVNEVFKKELDTLDDQTKDLLDRMLNYMEKKCISIPMRVAKDVFLEKKVG